MTTPTEFYIQTFHRLVDAIHEWGMAHPDDLVDVEFPDDTTLIGELSAIPPVCLKNDSSRALVKYLAEKVPDATIDQFRSICEGMAAAMAAGTTS